MFGVHVHRAVLASGDTLSGATVHFVDADYDTGKVIAQRSVELSADDTADTLARRVQAAERELIVQVLGEFAKARSSPMP